MLKSIHGGNIDEICRVYNIDKKSIIDFSANINPLGLNLNIKNSIINNLEDIVNYPDITYYELKKEISSFENIKKENIFLGNGAAECIFNLVRALNPKKTLLLAPSFSEYEEAVNSVCGDIEYFLLKEEDDFKITDKFLESLDESIDLVFICNPNNPTGVITKKDYLEKIIKRAHDLNIFVAVDESFLDFVEDKEDYSVMDLVYKYSNLVIIKSLTKFYAMPGLRIGFGVTANKDLLKNIDRVTMSWNVNTLASVSAICGLKQDTYNKDSILYVNKEREYLYNSLKDIKGLKVFNPSVNFIFFKIDKDIDLKMELLKYGILIRSCNNYIGLDDMYYRIAVRTREENEKIISALSKVFDYEK